MMSDPVDPPRDPSNVHGRTSASCRFCGAKETGRNLILSFDGTSNQYGKKNTNVIELHSRIIKDENQLRYYNSGIGTYARPSWRSYKYCKQVLINKIDLAIAWNFEKGVFAGYRWLSNHYQPGDKIFLFGFSRGAYQVRTLAGMIHRVGLLFPGNDEQIPFAFELYADFKGNSGDVAVKFFKDTFSQDNVKVHFLGAWDTVSSVGIFRGKNFPTTDEFNSSICYFRHALALDERRVKYLPEYVCGGTSYLSEMTEQPYSNVAQAYDETASNTSSTVPQVKEVWFAGCHSDIGGGNENNEKLNNAAIHVLWMGNEANLAGLRLEPSTVQWNWEQLKQNKPVKSLRSVWRWFELWPFKRLSYDDGSSTTWWPHLKEGRVIKPGQKIHASVAFIEQEYRPKANFAEGMTWKWDDILRMGKQDQISWTKGIEDILEMDLFDHLKVPALIHDLKQNIDNFQSIGRLGFLAHTREGAQAILKADPKFMVFVKMLHAKKEVKLTCLEILKDLNTHVPANFANMQADTISALAETLGSDDEDVLNGGTKLIVILASNHEAVQAIASADSKFALFSQMLRGTNEVKLICVAMLINFAEHVPTSLANMQADFISTLTTMLQSGDNNVQNSIQRLLLRLASTSEGAQAICRADPKCTSFSTLHSVIRQRAIKSILAGMQKSDDEKVHIEGRKMLLLLSGRPKISMNDVHEVLPTDFCEFEITVVGATGLCGTTAWPPSRCYATLVIDNMEIHETVIFDSGGEPLWNDVVQFIAKRSDNLVISVYFTSTSGSDTLLGQITETLEDADRTGDDISRNVFSAKLGISFALNFRFEPRSRMFGLIIGIDKYKSENRRDLQGCKRSAQSMIDFLSYKFHIRSSDILCLADKRATRNAIISGFKKHLIENSSIKRGDAIVIFYSGHGAQVSAPDGWVADGDKIEIIEPHDELTPGPDHEQIFGIPNRTIGGLLRQLSCAKGNNITAIFDSCHSGGMTRMSGVRTTKRTMNMDSLPEDLDKDIWMWGLPAVANPAVPASFSDTTMSSHVLLAACQRFELVHDFEDPSTKMISTSFIRHFIRLLYQVDATRITYSAFLDLMPPLENEHPLCAGKYKNRVLFSPAVGAPAPIKLSRDAEKYRAEAGEMSGVVKGTLFAIHALGNTIGILKADTVFPHRCTLRRQSDDTMEFDIPPGATASVLNWRQRDNMLKVFIESPCDAIQPVQDVFALVDASDNTELVIHRTGDGTLQFERLDPLMSQYTRVLNDVPFESNMSHVLEGVSHFNFHLSRRNIAHPLRPLVKVTLHCLTQCNPEQILEEPIYMPDGDAGRDLVLDHKNILFSPNDPDFNDTFYGFTLRNDSGRDLFPYLLYFDPDDYSISSWYHPPCSTIVPLAAKSELPIGYGSADSEAFKFSVDKDVAFLRLFVSTTYVDLSVLERSSAFFCGGEKLKSPIRVANSSESADGKVESHRCPASGSENGDRSRGKKRDKPPYDIWDVWTYVLSTTREGDK